MTQKTFTMAGFTIGSLLGSYIPTLFGAGMLSYTSVLVSGVGGIAGIYIGYKLGSSFGN
ncbi:MAG: hypothetical protein NUV65_02235 [Candidatus Roizmanbacteria bacterium]|nr:hypothetical protein [Candidatus Roizmanbacteria bacterium]